MINALVGASGGGKSYEAVVYHILEALRQGRKVITNVPVNVDAICQIDPSYRLLLVRRDRPLSGSGFPFREVSEYLDDWAHPEHGYGVLIVVDECHKVLRRGTVSPELRNWFAEHRHARCDILLITQSLGKVDKEIVDNLQMVYRVRKATMIGRTDQYVRHVQDGPKGADISEEIRTYNPAFFKFYKSHTHREGGGVEAGVSDSKPDFKKWFRRAAVAGVIVAIALVYGVYSSVRAFKTAQHSAAASSSSQPARHSARTEEHAVPRTAADPSSPVPQQRVAKTEADAVKVVHAPYEGMGIHIIGRVGTSTRKIYLLTLSLNGSEVQMMTSEQFVEAGYEFEPISDCAASVRYGDGQKFFVRCDRAVQVMHSQMPGDTSSPAASPGGGFSASSDIASPSSVSRPFRSAL